MSRFDPIYLHPEHKGLIEELDLELDEIGNIKTNQNFMINTEGIFFSW